jgi:precorrin-6A/cobalt-precorrin-6A reductase
MPRLTPPAWPGRSDLSHRTVLVLGGTSEGRALAEALAGACTVISSLAGRTRSPLRPPGEVRIGGFGGVDGLVAFLRERRIDALVDATHPFAGRISSNAATAATITGVPLLILRRPGWLEQPGDDWRRVADLPEAAARLPALGERIFLTTGRQGIAAFADLDACWFLARSVEPPTPPMPDRLDVLLDRGPFTVESELRLLREHRIDVLVSKDSGGPDAKLAAARVLGLPVVLVNRPALPAAGTVVGTVAEAVARL